MNDIGVKPRLNVIGVGPGDPELLTYKAARLIALADVIVYPTTGAGQSKARQTAAEHITAAHEELGFHLPMAVDPKPAQHAYDVVAGQMRARLDAGKSVALLCEGDPFFYGSAMHLYARLSRDYATHVVPGISSLTAGAAVAGLPLASRSEMLKVLPATMDEARLRAELANGDAAVIIKVGRHFDKVHRAIAGAGLENAAVLIEAATQDTQRIVAFSDVDRGHQAYFSMVLVSRRGGRS